MMSTRCRPDLHQLFPPELSLTLKNSEAASFSACGTAKFLHHGGPAAGGGAQGETEVLPGDLKAQLEAYVLVSVCAGGAAAAAAGPGAPARWRTNSSAAPPRVVRRAAVRQGRRVPPHPAGRRQLRPILHSAQPAAASVRPCAVSAAALLRNTSENWPAAGNWRVPAA